MLALELAPLVHSGFQLTPRLEEQVLVVNFAGNGDMSAVEALGRYLKQVHQEAVSRKVSEVSFDFRDLYFMNSSCFKAFVTWIDVASRAEEHGYVIRFLTNPRLHWQRRSLEALRCLSPSVVRVEPLKL
ncbi:MAG TPA: hypothetical protein VG937_20065 [Polyangiaceae bacterium]|jgi:hypothetical protein|nr:hypothetical protein [Polyangiaceae bacterium]